MHPLRFRPAALAALLLLPLAAQPLWAAPPAGEGNAKEVAKAEALGIVSAKGTHAFDVEVMRTDADRSRGLMYRRSMAPNHGMLFDFERPQTVNMWMKNTYLPLDMVFIRSDGTIARIAPDTEPLSTRIIPSDEEVLAVLELNAGTAAKLGIRAGDRVDHALFKGR